MPLLSEDDLCRSPQWYPLRFASRDSVQLVELSEEAYRAASFLDERLLAGNPSQATCELDALVSAAARLESRAFYLFHIGHVGSTLISRLISAHKRLFSLREPALLRAFADPAAHPVAPSLEHLLALLSRTWKPDQRAVIKATSIVNEAAEAILSGGHRPAAIFMYAAPVNYLRGILGGPNSRLESKTLAPGRQRRLEQRLGAQVLPPVLSEGEQIAMNWLSEMTVLHQAAMRFQAQILWADFDEFLRNPVGGLDAIFRALGVEYPEKEIQSLIAGPIMRQYSKAPEHHYDAALRREVFQSADWEHGGEIKRGLSWLGQAAADSPLVQSVLIGASQHGKLG